MQGDAVLTGILVFTIASSTHLELQRHALVAAETLKWVSVPGRWRQSVFAASHWRCAGYVKTKHHRPSSSAGFGDNKVVDADSEPLVVVYHRSGVEFDV